MQYLRNLEARCNRLLSRSIDMESHEGFLITILLLGLLVTFIMLAVFPGWGS